VKMMLPSIDYNKKIFIDREVEDSITEESQSMEIENGTVNKLDENPKKPCKVTHLDPEKYYHDLFKECKDNSKICIRILSYHKIPNKPKQINKSPPNKIEEFITNLLPRKKPESFCFNDSIIIHIHGGGFIAMSSRSHQNYTRKWANQLKIPIFSIDYRLAPEFTYPAAVDDCWQAYNWILKNAYDMFGF
jgi:hormone-sensitive lipase